MPSHHSQPHGLRRPARLDISSIRPSVSAGRYPSKRVLHDIVTIETIIVCDGHESIAAQIRLLQPDGAVVVLPLVRQPGYLFVVDVDLAQLGRYEFVVEAWLDHAATLQSKITRKRDAGQDTANEDAELLALRDTSIADPSDPDFVVSRTERIVVDPVIASFGAWYEFFPRSAANPVEAGSDQGGSVHGTFRDCIARLPYVRDLGYDIVYLPPIHPIGRSHRKGADNAVHAGLADVGSPWAIGAAEGGHTAIHPALGTIADFDDLVAATEAHGLALALDIAFQCAPDHPWITEHPQWFAIRPDGSIAYAENPPKKYQDIVPFNFDTDDWEALWAALAAVVQYWHSHGVRVFRVDNPHTKAFPFWEWMIAELKAMDPSIIFLAEAFAHPDVMLQLSRVGFSVSYTHFPWQHAPWQLEQYFQLLAEGDNIEHFRSSAWVNTPDILTAELQQGLRQVFVSRLVLAATLSASYGVYGPVFELQVAAPVREGSEEYARSEKYEVRAWDLDQSHSLRHLMRHINDIRRAHPALHHDRTLVFHHCANERVVAYTKTPPQDVAGDPILVVVNTDHWNAQDSMVHLDVAALGPAYWHDYEAHDLLSGAVHSWHGADNWIRLDPWVQPAHVFALRPKGTS